MLGPSRPWRGQPAVRTLPSAAAGTGETNGLPARPWLDAGGSRPPSSPVTAMNPLSMILVGLAMSTDAFAAAVGKGAAMRHPRLREALRVGLIFGVIETVTPLVGWLLGTAASRYITAWDHWIAFCVLGLLGLHMIWNGIRPADDGDGAGNGGRHGFWNLAATGLGTSIDAMALGVSLAFLDAPILLVAVVIGLCTLAMVTTGIMLGRVLGSLAGRRAEIIGGVILIVVGSVILREHLGGAA